jgi:hypothetical protein
MQVHILNHTRHDMVVHAVGCADIAKQKRKGEVNSDWILDVPDGKDVAEAVADDMSESFGWTEGDEDEKPWRAEHIRIMPCVGKVGRR